MAPHALPAGERACAAHVEHFFFKERWYVGTSDCWTDLNVQDICHAMCWWYLSCFFLPSPRSRPQCWVATSPQTTSTSSLGLATRKQHFMKWFSEPFSVLPLSSAAPKLGNPSVYVATTLLSAHWILLKVHTPLVSAAFLVDYSSQSSYTLCTPYYMTWSSHRVNTERDVFHFILDQNSASGVTRWWWELSVAESDGGIQDQFHVNLRSEFMFGENCPVRLVSQCVRSTVAHISHPR